MKKSEFLKKAEKELLDEIVRVVPLLKPKILSPYRLSDASLHVRDEADRIQKQLIVSTEIRKRYKKNDTKDILTEIEQ